MYSPRKRYRRYTSKKFYRNRLFAPSLRKAPPPNYYQMKGRIYQQSPRIMKEPPTELITRSKLDKMYETLQKYKYPFPNPPAIDPSQYFFNVITNPVNLYSLPENVDFDIQYFQNIIDGLEKPPVPPGYHYNFDVAHLYFSYRSIGSTDPSRYDLIWQSDFLQNRQLNILDKQIDSNIDHATFATIGCVPYQTNQCLVNRIYVTAAAVNITSSKQTTVDPVVIDDGYYPLVSSDSTSETYGSKLSYVCSQQHSSLLNQSFRFHIILYLAAD